MTHRLAAMRPLSGSEGRAVAANGLPPAVVVAIGSLLSFALSWPHLQAVWQTGTFFDTDDAMRMVQVRTWLDGQGWFDLTVRRLHPPDGLFLHWSRVVDLPLGAMIRLFEHFMHPATAELVTRIVFPLALQVALIAATVFAAGILVGPGTASAAMTLVVTCGLQFSQFPAGRIDHHAPQIVLLMTMTGLACDVLIRASIRSAILAALCIACSLAISLENLPFIVPIVAALSLAWAVYGETQASALRAFGLALGVCAAAFFAATVGPARYLVVSPDAFSLPHLLALSCGGGALAALARSGSVLRTPGRRLTALAAAGLAVMGVVALCPGALQSPYALIDPVVRAVWLSRVTEAMPLPHVIRLHPQALTLMVCPIAAGLVAMALAMGQARGRVRAAWILVGVLTAIGFAGACWEVRVVASTTPLALLGGIWAFAALTSNRASGPKMLGAWAILVLFSPVAWLLMPTPVETGGVAAAADAAAACREAANVTPLGRLPPGIVVAPIDAGSHLLVHTPLAVIGAPYHRNDAGNRTVIDALSADPDQAEAIVKGTQARYVALCPGQVQATALADRNPQGLAAALLAGRAPPWLEPISLPGTSYEVFAVR